MENKSYNWKIVEILFSFVFVAFSSINPSISAELNPEYKKQQKIFEYIKTFLLLKFT